LKNSWINTRWTYVYRKNILQSLFNIVKLINFEIEWICISIISRKFNTGIFNFVKSDRLVSELNEYIESGFPWELPVSVEAVINSSETNLNLKRMLMSIVSLHNMRNQVESSIVKGERLNKELWIQIVRFVSVSFSLSKFNCSSFAINDLRNIYLTNKKFEKPLIRYTFYNLKGSSIVKNKKTLILKESLKLYKERKDLYPHIVEQGLIK
jgi:hypothetical protein